ncbi:MAG: DNA polymerase III subunit delta' [Candidatus Thioglobus sp.]|jgi:DNA polymerase-3 subunit delta'|uniref:DNA polymerase III subunit delta' n=1 Tax=Candidatus Thioglobus sp. TaxID=2026721 RepID=UPI001D4F6B07|nr:DNA polymerase III subunit delta' [Candidatus Thioglobus sp.]MBT3276784.1 DNA polymerase III subunit delta' [Candidatus Thioglobus sp.]MBT3447649.1 DNA polymerase III subunit delta' [Candidatus Thioglobus sp.]MBT4181828.1 DNA polymerase III subunit delta' [Candidatus Thioglobus sp.]MBT4746622.1 DNA polymerase III subunit delta' [Candidatus Thioglobus sp.]MBT5164814.1 DNA polymerase III subunit delta' [Candidatus Thioglobus sp.]
MNLPWHDQALSKLQKMIDQNHLPHALLMTGAEQIGKFELMQQLVGILLKDDALIRKDNILQELDHPVLIRRSSYTNMIYCRSGEINANTKNRSKDIRIDQVRAFCEALNKTADNLQIGVIFYGDQMTVNAANSLLKTLEEPRENTLIIILAHNIQNLPATIVSRCQNIHIAPNYAEETQAWIKAQLSETQNADFDIAQLLENTHGVPFKVLSELSDGSYATYQAYQNQLLNIASHPLMISQTQDFEGNELAVLDCLQNLIVEAIKLKTTKQEGGLVELNQLVKSVKSEFLFQLLDDVYRAIRLSKTSINLKLLLDNILIVWSHITHLKQYPQISTNY